MFDIDLWICKWLIWLIRLYIGYPSLQINDAGKIKNSDIAKELSLPPVKLHCSSKFCYCLLLYCHRPSIPWNAICKCILWAKLISLCGMSKFIHAAEHIWAMLKSLHLQLWALLHVICLNLLLQKCRFIGLCEML